MVASHANRRVVFPRLMPPCFLKISFFYLVTLFFLRKCNAMFFLDFSVVESFKLRETMSSRTILIISENSIISSPVCKHFGRQLTDDLENCAHFWKISSCAPVNSRTCMSNHAILDKKATVSIVVLLHGG